QARLGGGRIHRMQAAQLRRARHQRQRRARIRQTAEDAIQRQLRQQYAGPEHRRQSRASGTAAWTNCSSCCGLEETLAVRRTGTSMVTREGSCSMPGKGPSFPRSRGKVPKADGRATKARVAESRSACPPPRPPPPVAGGGGVAVGGGAPAPA